MTGYIDKLLIKYGKPWTHKPQLSPHKHSEETYGSKEKLTHEEDTSPALDNKVNKHIHGIFGARLYYAREVDNKLLVGLSAIGDQQVAIIQHTNEEIHQLLNYSATYPTNGILYLSNDIVLCAHSDKGFHNKSKYRSRAGAHIFLSKNDPMPNWNGPVLTLAHIIKFDMSSASKAELGEILSTSQEMV